MASVYVQLEGLDKVIAQYSNMKGSDAAVRRACYAEATVVLNESKRLVPVDTGNLRASGRVEPPKTQGSVTTIEVSYGGAAAPYALYVHEIPPGSGGRWGTGMTHAAGKTYKFLEIPALAHRDKFVDGVRDRLAEWVADR